MSFSRKSVNDIREKLTKQNISSSNYSSPDSVRVSTFHAFGNSYLNGYYHADLNEIFKKFIFSKILDDFSIYEDLKINYGNYYYYSHFTPPEDKSVVLKIKEQDKKFNITALDGTRVRSIGDFKIANFLILNRIKFIYEPVCPKSFQTHRKVQFDFYLPEYDIYLEDIRLQRNFKPLFRLKSDRDNYIEQINFKLNIFKNSYEDSSVKRIRQYKSSYGKVKSKNNSIYKNKNGSSLIILNTYLNDEFLIDLKERLIECGVKFDTLSNQDIINFLDSKKYITDIYKVRNSFNNFVKILKEIGLSKEDLKKEVFNFEPLLPLALEYFDFYTDFLEKNNLIDFSDMIIKSIPLIKDLSYKYVLVDEYQDISHTRFNLLKKIKEVSGSKLVVVGDDWQSIYGFTGSDVELFSNFEKYFKDSKKVYLEETYRASNQLIKAAGDFIDNDNLIKKKLYSEKNLTEPIELRLFTGLNKKSKKNKEDALVYKIIEELSEDENNHEVMILARYNLHLKTLKKLLDEHNIEKFGIDISYNTFHTAKGLEFQNVIILDVNGGIFYEDYGIPYVNHGNEFLSIERLLGFNQLEEERRLFYVGLTRTKNKVYLCSDKEFISPFIEELDKNCIREKEFVINETNPIFSFETTIYDNWDKKRTFKRSEFKCPKCGKNIRMYIIQNKKFIICSNFKECGWFVDEEIINDNAFEDIKLCKMCNKGIIFSNNDNERRFCSNKLCINSQNYLKNIKEKGQKELSDFKDMGNNTKIHKSVKRKRKVQSKLYEF